MADADSENDMSGDEMLDGVGEFDLLNINQVQRRNLEREWRDLVGDSDDEEEFEGFEPVDVYVNREFDNWRKVEVPRNIIDFDRRVGPVRLFDTSATALNLFQLFYTDEVFHSITNYTNLNALRKRTADHVDVNGNQLHKGMWTDVSLPEIKAYYGLLILMDTMKFERDEMYWSESSQYKLVGSRFGEIMPRDRYVQIKRYLHFNDDDVDHEGDKLYKIRFMLDTCRTSFQREYIPHREISVDEAMIPFKGRLGMKQYMKDKPVKFGIKLWVAADAISAYCVNFEVYVGKNDAVINRTFGLSSKVVIELTKFLEKKGHVIYTDNFYTSPQLADYLYSRDTYLCGTIRNNRKGYPKALVQSPANLKRMERGAFDWLMCGPLLASYWKDNRIVYYLSSYHAAEDDQLTTSRKSKDGTANQLAATPTQQAYALYMGGVDRLDQMTRVSKDKKSLRWYRKIETKLRQISIYNAYVIEGNIEDHVQQGKRKRDLLSFKLDLAHALIGDFKSKKTFKRPRTPTEDERLDNKEHWPVGAGGKDRLCVVCNKKHRNYEASHPGVLYTNNPHKRSKTTMKCSKCDVPLCCNARNTCFVDYHTKVYYWQ